LWDFALAHRQLLEQKPQALASLRFQNGCQIGVMAVEAQNSAGQTQHQMRQSPSMAEPDAIAGKPAAQPLLGAIFVLAALIDGQTPPKAMFKIDHPAEHIKIMRRPQLAVETDEFVQQAPASRSPTQ